MMRIQHIEIYRFSIPIVPFAIATGTMTVAQNTLIKIFTEDGLTGYGECSAFPMIVGETQDTCLVIGKEFARLWIGKDASDIVQRMQQLDAFIAKNTTIKSAFNIALYDLNAQKAQKPLYEFLGGTYKEVTSDITVGIDAPEKMAAQALSFKNNGAKFLKVKVGKDFETDLARIKSIRATIGYDIPIRIDANQGWSMQTATSILKALESYNIEFCEQPMRTYDDEYLPTLKVSTTIPIMADESVYNAHDAERLCKQQACQYINIKFSKSGSIGEALKIQSTAKSYGVPCMIGGMLESRLALTAKFHFALAADNVIFYDLDTCLLGHLVDPVVGGVQFEDYTLKQEKAFGLGASVDETFLANCEKWVIN